MVERPKTDTHPHLQQILELPVNLACLQTVKENIHMQRGKNCSLGNKYVLGQRAVHYLLSMLYLFFLLKYSDFVVLIKNKNNCYKNVV